MESVNDKNSSFKFVTKISWSAPEFVTKTILKTVFDL